MCCAEAGDPISTDSNVAAPKNRVLVILLLLIIDPANMGRRRTGPAFRPRHSRQGSEHRLRFSDPDGGTYTDACSERRLGAPQAQTQNIENNPMQSSPRDAGRRARG